MKPSIPSPSSLRSATSPIGRGKGDSYGTPTAAGDGGTIDLTYQIVIENTEAGMIDYHLDIRAK